MQESSRDKRKSDKTVDKRVGDNAMMIMESLPELVRELKTNGEVAKAGGDQFCEMVVST